MSHHHKLRKDKHCLNCGQEVDDRYCPHCGQENIEPRQPFHYLFGHVVEDITHYDHGFWETFKTLMARPGKLIKKYIAGKRASQVPPVKLYIFVSFVAFFLPSILFGHHDSDKKEDHNLSKNTAIHELNIDKEINNLEVAKNLGILSDQQHKEIQKKIDSLKHVQKTKNKNDSLKNVKEEDDDDDEDLDATIQSYSNDTSYSLINLSEHYRGFHTVVQIDSVQQSLSQDKKPNNLQYKIQRKYMELREDGVSNKAIVEKYIESFFHNLPKLLLIYLPLFAFFIWLFHNKKQWFYFDHGVFTLYFFSFLLTTIIIFELVLWLGSFVNIHWINTIKGILLAALTIYPFIYFFLAEHRVYGGSKAKAIGKGLVLLFVNFFFMALFFVGYVLLIGYLMH